MDQKNYKKLLGSRILSEANDLKRTLGSLARDLCVDEKYLSEIVEGKRDKKEMLNVIEKMGTVYPIESSDLCLIEDDCDCSVKVMRAEESRTTSRIFTRKNKDGGQAPYYEYRDTAMSKLGPFKPEWIRELRPVHDADPENPDVVYNNGHSLHQATFFIGPVNFYWEVAGKKFCREMNTGDSNYITPYWRHSFSTRDEKQLALIIAVTFGGDVRRAQKEFYALGERGIVNYRIDHRNPRRATTQLIRQHMDNASVTADILNDMVRSHSIDLNIGKLLDENEEKSTADLQAFAKCLNIQLSDLLLPPYAYDDEVVVKHKSENDAFFYPGKKLRIYKIHPLAGTVKMPLLRGLDLEVLSASPDRDRPLVTSLHSYLYNYGDSPVKMTWEDGGQLHEVTLSPEDSAYIQPFVKHAFSNCGVQQGRLCVFRASGAINTAVQKELSYYSSIDRIVGETKCWFDP